VVAEGNSAVQGHSDGAVVRSLHCKCPDLGFESGSYLSLRDVFVSLGYHHIRTRCDQC